jgi:hypothetical protein
MLRNSNLLTVPLGVVVVVTAVPRVAFAIDQSVPFIGGDVTRTLLGDGTGVVVGVIDSGVDDLHPGLAGLDSLGRPRLLAEGNFVPTEPTSTGDDSHGHGTGVAGVILGADPDLTGLVPDARFVNGRVLDRFNGFGSTSWVVNGAGFAVDAGADVLNLSLNTFGEFSDGQLGLDRMLDWAAAERGVMSVISAGNILQANVPNVRSPAGGFNVIAVGRTRSDFQWVDPNSSVGPTSDGRSKPDVVAPGTFITTYSDDWETDFDFRSYSGTSFAAPHVAGLLAQQIDFGRSQGLATDPRVLKATVLNSADKILGKQGQPWAPGASSLVDGVLEVTSPLDYEQGAGQVNALSLYDQYVAGEQGPGKVAATGWDLGTVVGETFVDYVFDQPLLGGSAFTATLSWFRDILRFDDGDTLIDAGDSFALGDDLDDLDLSLLLGDEVVARSVSDVDSVEHLHFDLPASGFYTLRVGRDFVSGSGPDETFGLAWDAGVAIPGDANGDGTVNLSDFLVLRRNFGQSVGFAGGDFNGDGTVNLSDFLILRRNFGSGPGSGALDDWYATVPEPAGLAVLAVVPACLMRRRRGRIG